MSKPASLFLIILAVALCNCEGVFYGCTTCSAINFDPYATTDDGSCLLLHGNLIGEHLAIDTVIGGPGLDTSHAEILVYLDQRSCAPHEMSILGLIPSSFSESGVSIILTEDDSILIPSQYFEYYDDYLHSLSISEANGILTETQLEFSYYYSTTFDAYQRKICIKLE